MTAEQRENITGQTQQIDQRLEKARTLSETIGTSAGPAKYDPEQSQDPLEGLMIIGRVARIQTFLRQRIIPDLNRRKETLYALNRERFIRPEIERINELYLWSLRDNLVYIPGEYFKIAEKLAAKYSLTPKPVEAPVAPPITQVEPAKVAAVTLAVTDQPKAETMLPAPVQEQKSAEGFSLPEGILSKLGRVEKKLIDYIATQNQQGQKPTTEKLIEHLRDGENLTDRQAYKRYSNAIEGLRQKTRNSVLKIDHDKVSHHSFAYYLSDAQPEVAAPQAAARKVESIEDFPIEGFLGPVEEKVIQALDSARREGKGATIEEIAIKIHGDLSANRAALIHRIDPVLYSLRHKKFLGSPWRIEPRRVGREKELFLLFEGETIASYLAKFEAQKEEVFQPPLDLESAKLAEPLAELDIAPSALAERPLTLDPAEEVVVPYRIPEEQKRSLAETAVLEVIVNQYLAHGLFVVNIHRGLLPILNPNFQNGSDDLIMPVEQLYRAFQAALNKLQREESTPLLKENWTTEDKVLWDNLQRLISTRKFKGTTHLVRRVGIELRKTYKDYKELKEAGKAGK